MECPFHGKDFHYVGPWWPYPPKGVCPKCWYTFARFIPLRKGGKNGN